MHPASAVRQKALLFAAPLMGVVLLYVVVFERPLARELAQHRTQQQKLEQVAARRLAENAGGEVRLAGLRAEERALALELENAKSIGAKLVIQRADRRAELFRSSSPASMVSHALELLARHGLECLDSSPSPTAASAAGPLEPLQPVAELLGGTSDKETSRRQVRIKLAGRFEDMQAAVRDMHASLPDIFTVSLEMEAADGLTHRRIWVLTISV